MVHIRPIGLEKSRSHESNSLNVGKFDFVVYIDIIEAGTPGDRLTDNCTRVNRVFIYSEQIVIVA